jgi:2-oxo-4-hydroxy-4-carboxy-5-ureidoimidazoline decarboxylase
MSQALARWNKLDSERAVLEILPCCGSSTWARLMVRRRPIVDETALLVAGDQLWNQLTVADWDEAFRSHPRIGESPDQGRIGKSAAWSGEEQHRVGKANQDVKQALAEGNVLYEQRFHRIFIICATGKSAQEILAILQRRLQNDEQTELREAAEEQRKITNLRLKKWLAS